MRLKKNSGLNRLALVIASLLIGLLSIVVEGGYAQSQQSDIGLSWSDSNRDTLCNGLLEVFLCSTASIQQENSGDALNLGEDIYTLYISTILFPRWLEEESAEIADQRGQSAVAADFRIVLEMPDGSKETFSRNDVEIERHEEEGSMTLRSASLIIALRGRGAKNVLSISITERDSAGRTLSMHEFR